MCVTPSATSPSMVAGTDIPAALEPEHLPREERRKRTEAAILEAARELFAEHGFERTTIRAVAAKAGIDPALVMQYYGNKEGLFAASARWHVDHKRIATAALGDIATTALTDVFEGFEDADKRDGAIALLRNCLTHDSALEVVRDEVMCETQAMIAKTIGGPDAELRAALLGSTVMGLILGRSLLQLPALQAASPDDIKRLLTPVLEQIVTPATS